MGFEKIEKMGKRKKDVASRLNVTLPSDLSKRLNDYCVKIANRNGMIPHAIRTKIARRALKMWLDKYEEDLTLEF